MTNAPIKPRPPMETASADQPRSPFYGARGRVDTLLARALETVERDGLTVDGEPHPMLSVIPLLTGASTDLRKLSLDRKAFAQVAEQARGEITGELERRRAN
ncbi:hypothetical protein ACFYPZ_19535 [Streptomyces sp. NPDC005506]|uniref:hypothetical protein n=1 Tax=Streptomyces sp. NPDC005506 TaxID=3364718 RepID=UPI0036C8DC52